MNALSTLMVWWALFTVATGVLANYKGRSDTKWLIAGMILGPVALTALAFLPSKKLVRTS